MCDLTLRWIFLLAHRGWTVLNLMFYHVPLQTLLFGIVRATTFNFRDAISFSCSSSELRWWQHSIFVMTSLFLVLRHQTLCAAHCDIHADLFRIAMATTFNFCDDINIVSLTSPSLFHFLVLKRQTLCLCTSHRDIHADLSISIWNP